jgi:hypothetical protein
MQLSINANDSKPWIGLKAPNTVAGKELTLKSR